MSLQSCYLIPTVDKPNRVRHICSSVMLIDNIFVNTPEQVPSSGNIISDISDHFSQFCILKSAANKPNIGNCKVRDFSNFSIAWLLHADLSQVNWNDIIKRGNTDVDRPFSSFYYKYNMILSKHAPFKTLSNRRKNNIIQALDNKIIKGIRA